MNDKWSFSTCDDQMIWAVLVLSSLAVPSLSQTEPDCKRKCGNVDIPYPFGVGDNPKCFQDAKFNLFCNETNEPPMLFTFKRDNAAQVLNISLEGQATMALLVATACYTQDGKLDDSKSYNTWTSFNELGYRFSETRNKLTAIGCDTLALISDDTGQEFENVCTSFCTSLDRVISNKSSCDGIGCCQTAIPKNVSIFNVTLSSIRNHTQSWSFNPCSYAFLADLEWFKFNISDLKSFTERLSYHRNLNLPTVPAVLDWAIGKGTCEQAQSGDPAKYACKDNTNCTNSNNGPGYHCNCLEGYNGNPYLGCQDIDECADKSENKPCEGLCHNTTGSYTCSCPKGQSGDGRNRKRGGSGCTKSSHATPVIPISIGIGLGSLFLVLITFLTYWSLKKRKLIKLKEKFFYQNGGLLLKQKLSSDERFVESTKIFSSEQLKAAADNYHESRILGRGGYGTVYKGILSDGRVVAIKKSKVIDKEQIEQFINEVLILSGINHRNVVNLLGCCLETEVPLLVYEFINNGTLFHHLHDEELKHTISWSNRLRIAAETSGALAYLHSSASQPIIHRDIKSTNILLDGSYISKVADFGASRMIALDQTQLSTIVQGTMGYLDPEYMQTGLLTNKSDVYSFGVVLVELLTGRSAVSFDKPEAERILAMFFVTSLNANCLFEILERQIVTEENNEQLNEVANLARRCLRMNSEERPTMKEVAMELEGIRMFEKHAWNENNPVESDYLLAESVGFNENSVGYDSMKDQMKDSLHGGR